ncbi:DUF885 family protein [Arenimonas sp. GDDSR-1]|uniref:DUF885 domain-containing protein n=1 Tax=Arenimonas sp. GDDSR-1 TaxID=2950125 RepID=UPI002606DA26|nr:DUF885 family protein [Arenimonas sp. GDDSR-1]
MKLRPLVIAIALAASLGACNKSNEAPATEAAAVDQAKLAAELEKVYADYWEANLKLNPINATFIGDTRYNDQMPNFFTADFRKQAHDLNQAWLDKALALDGSRLEGPARISYDIFIRERQLSLESERFPTWMLPMDQFSSFAAFLPMLGSGSSAQPFATVQDYDNWLKRGAATPAIFDQAIANMREGMKAGVVQPKVLMTKVLPQLDAIIKDDPTQTTFWGPIANMPKEFSDADRKRLTEAYRAMIADGMMPAYKRMRAFIAEEYLPACRDTVSLSALPDGDAWYAFNAKTQTTTDLTPAQIHDIGLKEVERIHGEMRQVMQQVGFKGDLQAFFKFMTTDKQFEFKSEAELLAAYNALRTKIDARIPEQFSLLPKAGFEIRPVEPFRAESMAGGQYFPPSEDGTRPGIFYVNTFDLPSRKTWDAEDLYLHEAIPGHHFQIAIQQELKDVPAFRRFGGETAFAEGWGLYAESLGKDLGVYTDPYQYFGRLQGELWRAIRLVVDTGLHSKGWTREQVIDYMKANSAVENTDAVAEAERYIAIPGQALAYKIGELKIQEQKRKAQAALGDKFDPRAFHAEVLKDGSVPLPVLEAKIDRWIKAQSGK